MSTETQIVTAVKGIVERSGRILTVRRSPRDESGGGSWEFPGGKIDFGEHPEEALVREVREETGLDITVGRVAYVSSILTSPVRQVVIITYACSTESEDVELSGEHTDYRWVDRGELQQMLPAPMIDDLKRAGVLTA